MYGRLVGKRRFSIVPACFSKANWDWTCSQAALGTRLYAAALESTKSVDHLNPTFKAPQGPLDIPGPDAMPYVASQLKIAPIAPVANGPLANNLRSRSLRMELISGGQLFCHNGAGRHCESQSKLAVHTHSTQSQWVNRLNFHDC
eukprot:364713-Chlamydomonas_euryale.AAC.2